MTEQKIDQIATAIASDYKRWGDVVRERNITAN